MKVKSVILHGYYNLDGEYLLFKENPLHGKIYENVNVFITKETRKVCGISYSCDVVSIEGCEPIECELVDFRETANGT